MIKVLWIEDGALLELAYLAAAVYLEGGYVISVATNASEAIEFLGQDQFDVLIIDIRLPPGTDCEWAELYQETGRTGKPANLGLELIQCVLGSKGAKINLNKALDWITPTAIGVFTVESSEELRRSLLDLGVVAFKQKRANMPDSVLLDLIRSVRAQPG